MMKLPFTEEMKKSDEKRWYQMGQQRLARYIMDYEPETPNDWRSLLNDLEDIAKRDCIIS